MTTQSVKDFFPSDVIDATSINTRLAAIRTLCAGDTPPLYPAGGQLFCYTTGGVATYLQILKADQSSWVTLFPDLTVDGGGLVPSTALLATRFRVLVQMPTLTASTNFPFMVGTDQRAVMVNAILVPSANIASDATDKWTIDLYDATGAVSMATTPFTTDGTALTAGVKQALVVDQNLTTTSNNVYVVRCVKGGSAAALSGSVVQIEYTLSEIPS